MSARPESWATLSGDQGGHGKVAPPGLPAGATRRDMTERLHFHVTLSCIGEGNGNPLQCSCLENPRDRGAWWAAVYGVAQSRTQLERLSSSTPFSTVAVPVGIPTTMM